MTDVVERYRSSALLAPHARARVMTPALGPVDVHWHDFYELSVVLEGRATHVLNGVPGALGPGSAFVLSPADLHEIRPHDGQALRCYNLVIDPDDVETLLDRLATGVTFPLVAEGCLDLASDLERLARELDDSSPEASVTAAALVTCLLVALVRRGLTLQGSQRVPAGHEGVRRAVRYVDRHFREPLSLADVAGLAHLSPNYFSERFHEVTGSSFQHYLQDRLLRFAHSLLQGTGLGVTEICHAAGFSDLSHFGRLYRRRFDTAPNQGRKRHDM